MGSDPVIDRIVHRAVSAGGRRRSKKRRIRNKWLKAQAPFLALIGSVTGRHPLPTCDWSFLS